MEDNRTSKIPQYLQELLDTLERRLANPHNTWKRREEIQSQIRDVQKRLATVTRSNRRQSYRSDRPEYTERPERRRSQRPLQRV